MTLKLKIRLLNSNLGKIEYMKGIFGEKSGNTYQNRSTTFRTNVGLIDVEFYDGDIYSHKKFDSCIIFLHMRECEDRIKQHLDNIEKLFVYNEPMCICNVRSKHSKLPHEMEIDTFMLRNNIHDYLDLFYDLDGSTKRYDILYSIQMLIRRRLDNPDIILLDKLRSRL